MSTPAFSFGTASRFLRPSAERAKRNPQVPGPGAYAAQSSIGKTVNSNHVTEAAFGFGTSTREHAAKVFLSSEQAKAFLGLESPGPAAYRVMSGIGTQQSSQNRTEPGYTVPKQPRRTTEKGLKRAPGPGQYSTVGSIGRQVDPHGDEADGGLR